MKESKEGHVAIRHPCLFVCLFVVTFDVKETNEEKDHTLSWRIGD